MEILNYLKKFDWILIGAAILLVSFGLLSIYSSSVGKEDFANFQKQILFFGIGLLLMFTLAAVDWRTFRENSYLIIRGRLVD